MRIHPGPKHPTLSPIAPFEEKDPDLQYEDLDDGEVETGGGDGLGPGSDTRMGVLGFS
jgi:hypothetical protein